MTEKYSSLSLHMKHILLVDDDTYLAELVALLLRDAGFSVVTVTTATMAYRELTRTTPNLILMDYMLPEEDGAMITIKLRQDRKTARIPVIMVSADHRAKRIAQDIGADGYFPKPFDVEKLIKCISKLTS